MDGNDLNSDSCGQPQETPRNIVIQVTEPAVCKPSPLMFQWYAKDYFRCYKETQDEQPFSPARWSLLAQALELAAKALHVTPGSRDDDLRHLGHSLMKACDPLILSSWQIELSGDEMDSLESLSKLHSARAFGYFWFNVPDKALHCSVELASIWHAIRGRPGLPDESLIRGVVERLLAVRLPLNY